MFRLSIHWSQKSRFVPIYFVVAHPSMLSNRWILTLFFDAAVKMFFLSDHLHPVFPIVIVIRINMNVHTMCIWLQVRVRFVFARVKDLMDFLVWAVLDFVVVGVKNSLKSEKQDQCVECKHCWKVYSCCCCFRCCSCCCCRFWFWLWEGLPGNHCF